MNKKAQFNVVISPPILFMIVGAVIGFFVAQNIHQDSTLGIIIGGMAGLLASRLI